MKRIAFTVYGEPQGKARPRFTRIGRVYTPVKTTSYEKEIAEKFRENSRIRKPLETDLKITIDAFFEPCKSYSQKRKEKCLANIEKPNKRPDIDNIAKAVLDGLNGIAYLDDKQIVTLKVRKRYSSAARIEVVITEEVE